MQTIKLLVLIFVLAARLRRAEVVIESLTPHQSITDLVEDLVTIVTTCYGDRIHGLGFAGDLPDTLVKTLSTQHSIPVIVIGDIETTGRTTKMPQEVPVQIRQKLHIFIVGASSYRQLGNIINMKIKYSIWWNNMALFLIIDWSRRCRKIADFMGLAWNSGILNAKVMCYNDYQEKVILTFNPFTSLAPDPWEKVAVLKGMYRHPFTVFFRKSRQTVSICANFDFDKVKDCGGYPIRVLGTPPKITKRDKFLQFQVIHFTEYRIFDTINRALRVTPIYVNDSYGPETSLESSWMLSAWNRDLVAYPHSQSELVLLSQFRRNKSHLFKILSVFDINSGIGLVITYLVALIFFKFVIRQALVPAILNLIRITCGTAFENLPHSSASRICLTGVLFLAVTMHGIFMGNFASLLTKMIPLRNVNTIQDILDFDYAIHGYDDIKTHLEPEVQKRYVTAYFFEDCITEVRNEKSSACICLSGGSIFYQARMFNLHVSRKAILTKYRAFFIKWNWPYEERFNRLLSRMVEADVLESWDDKCSLVKLENFQTDQEVKQNKDFKKIELGELTFAFMILGIGLLSASITFIVEMEIKRKYRPRCRVGIRRRKLRN